MQTVSMYNIGDNIVSDNPVWVRPVNSVAGQTNSARMLVIVKYNETFNYLT